LWLRPIAPEADQVVVEELAPVVGVQLSDREGQPREHTAKARLHCHLPAPEHGHPLTPPGRHVHQLQGVHVLTHRLVAAVVHQVHLKVPRFGFVPGDARHGDAPEQGVGTVRPLCPTTRQPTHVLRQSGQPALHAGPADAPELRLQFLGQP